MIAFVKFIHIAAIAVWAGGLISLPTCYRKVGKLRTDLAQGVPQDIPVSEMQDVIRFIYVGIVSPAAFVAVASGILLIFQGTVVAPWFALKLAFVVALVIAHSFAGLTISRLSEDRGGYPAWRYVGATGLSVSLAVAIIAVTLSKPSLVGASLPPVWSEPGALRSLVESVNPWHRP